MRYGILAFVVLAGCATGPSLQTRMAAYIGADEQTLVNQFGVPDKQITVNGTTYLAYEQRRAVSVPGAYLGGVYGPYAGPWFGGGFYPPVYDSMMPPRVLVYACETTFLLKGGKVVDFTLRGNDCG
ncbi:hypothetical protein [Acidocella sp.]|uniref:hypothetical protein n=1 Tax=Acidocella sp. TaxID=50710 RepID=UPI00184BB47E|nr:hypothetical protein [Acidocella sp.]NNM58180.1 hypothetical protein [Acidocella sp.]